MSRVVVHPKDVAQLRGTSYEAARKQLQRLRTVLGKPARALVSVAEFCAATGLPEHEVRAALR